MASISCNPTFHDIVARLIEANGTPLSEELARYILGFDFTEAERARINELCAKSRVGKLTDEEDAELEQFIRAGDFISLMQAKAHEALANQS